MLRNQRRNRWALGEALRLDGRTAEAREVLEDLAAEAGGADLRPLLARARASLRLLGASGSSPTAQHPSGLTEREVEVLLLVAEGLSTPEISARLRVARSTVDTLVRTARHKLGARTRREAAALLVAQIGDTRALTDAPSPGRIRGRGGRASCVTIGAVPTGRFAPSPTGPLHVGNLRTALVAWLAARSSGSPFLLRSEDLDPGARRDHEAGQLADLAAIGVDWDGPVVRQSERRDLYEDALATLERAGLTYRCYCTRREILEATRAPHDDQPEGAYPGTCRTLTGAERAAREHEGRPPALRLRADGVEVEVVDALHGRVRAVVDDLVLRRNDGLPAYNLAVVVDDAAQGVEEVVRADDLLSSTPRQAHLAALLDLPVPAYLHVPLVVGADGERLAKRHGARTLADLGRDGRSPGEVRAALLRSLGLAPEGTVPADEALLRAFDRDRLPRRPWRFDPHDLAVGDLR